MSAVHTQKTIRVVIPVAFGLWLLVTLSCRALVAQPTPTSQPKASDTPSPPPSATVQPTATATLSPSPTSTPTRTPTLDYPATSAAQSTQFAATALVDILDDLEDYDISTEEGQLVWLSTYPITLTVDTYSEYNFHMIDPKLIVDNFVFQTEVTWKSSSGLAGCGYNFRTSRSLSRGGYYEFFAIRLSGLPIWSASYWNEGYLEKVLTPNGSSSMSIRQKYGSRNKFAVVAKADRLTFYANGTRLGRVIDDKLSEGRLGFSVGQESGESTCIFDKSWVWALK